MKNFSPSFEFAARYGLDFKSGKYYLPSDLVPGWLAGEDVPAASPANGLISGSTVVVVDQDGRNLGRGRLLANRLKNLQKHPV